MLRQPRVLSAAKTSKNQGKKLASTDLPKVPTTQSKKSIKADNLSKTSIDRIGGKKSLKYDTLSGCTLAVDKDKNSPRRPKPKTLRKTSSAKSAVLSLPKGALPEPRSTIVVPDNIAAHFGNFYSTEGDKQKFDFTAAQAKPRTPFTRQMLHNLEQTAGTSEYAEKLSVLLEETLEPPNFRISQPPAESSIPYGKDGPTGFPRWYKEPHKMPITAMEEYLKLMEEFADMDYDSASKRMLEMYEKDSEEDEAKKSVDESSSDEAIDAGPSSSKPPMKKGTPVSSNSSSSLSSSEDAESDYTTSTSSANETEDEKEKNVKTKNAYPCTLSSPLFRKDLGAAKDKVVSL